MRYVFLGSPPFATPILAHLAGSARPPALVVTPPERKAGRGRRRRPSPVAELARAAGLSLLQPASVREEPFLDDLRAVEADVFLVVSYGELLRAEFLELPRQECLNVHPSLLPRHRGASPIPAAILAGDAETGVTIQRVVLELDAGEILLQERTPIQPAETAGELAVRLAELSCGLCVDALEVLERGTARFEPQDPDRVTFCRKLEKDQGRIDWERDSSELERHVRAMNPWPAARTHLPAEEGGSELTVWRARAHPDHEQRSAPGTVLEAGERFLVAAGPAEARGALELNEVQAAGRARMQAAAYLRGARLGPGDRLGASTAARTGPDRPD